MNQETSERRIQLPEDDPVSVARMVMWMYYGNITFDITCPDSILPLAKMLKADPAAIKSLKTPSERRAVVVHKAKIYTDMYEVADKFDLQVLKAQTVHSLGCMVNTDDEVFWTLRGYVTGSEIDCQPLRNIMKSARTVKMATLRKDPRFKDLIEEDTDFWWTSFSKIADERDVSAKSLRETKRSLESTEKNLKLERGKTKKMQDEIDTWKDRAMKTAARVKELERKPESRVTGTNGFDYTRDGQPICDRCDRVGHISRECP